MKKILYTGYSSNPGGIEQFLINICKNLDKEKFQISFLIAKGKPAYFQNQLEAMGIKFFEVTNRKQNYRQYIRDLKKIYQENNFDIIHFNIMSFSLFERILIAAKYTKARLIIHSHSSSIHKVYKRTKFLDKLGKFLCRNIKYEKIACGEEAGKWLFGKKEFLVLNNGIDIESFRFNQQNREKIRNEFGIQNKEIVLGLVAKLEEQKNPQFLVKTFEEYQKLQNNSKLILVGEGSLKAELEEMVKKFDIQNKVLFLGKREDTGKIYSAMDIFVMPSWFEGFSIALVEAQTNGLKCYTTTNVARESNITGNVKFLSLDESAKMWAKKIYEANNSRDEKASDKIPKQFRIEETVKVLSKIYEGK